MYQGQVLKPVRQVSYGYLLLENPERRESAYKYYTRVVDHYLQTKSVVCFFF